MPTLYVLQGPDKGRTYQTPDDTPDAPAVIGRSSDDIKLSDHSSSRRHAELRQVNGAWVLADLGSSNGTYVNGRRLTAPLHLKHGDQIKIGSTLMVFSGKEQVESIIGLQAIRDKVDLELGSNSGGSSILSTVDASEESVILQAPETADAVAAWNVIFKIAEMIGSLESLEGFLDRVGDIVFDHLIVDRLVILMRDSDEGDFEPQVVRYRMRERGQRPKIVTSKTIVQRVIESKDGILCANALTDMRFGAEGLPDSVHNLGMRSIICVPIIFRDDVMGIIHLDCSMAHHTYTQEQLRLVVAIGRLAGLAIENLRLLESRMQNERLAAAGEAVAYLSHYIRNILQGMQGGADVVEMAMRKGSVESAEAGWKLVRRNLDRIFILTMNMLTFSKQRQPRIETLQLNKVLEEVLQLAQTRADEKGVTIAHEFVDIPPIPLDPDGIHQVVNNILTNAIDAAPAHTGRINIATEYKPECEELCISVNDNGPGIPLEEQANVFKAFHSSKGHGGTGLGLAAAKKIITELDGAIQIESDGTEGTTFRIRVPTRRTRVLDDDPTDTPDQ